MLKVDVLPLGDYQTNCYIVREETSRTCAVIDPGFSPEQVLSAVNALGLQIDAILLTHGHFDHVGGVKTITKATGCAVWLHESDYSPARHPMRGFLYPLADCREPEIQFCEEMEQITAGGLTFTVYETPGHTRGSVCYRCGHALFSGDTLFAGSCGRTDLPGGDWNTIQHSLARLASMEEELTVYPGHGESTTLAAEKRYNPYMRG